MDPETLPPTAEVTHVSLYDGTLEGFCVPDLRATAVQFHPEAAPGPSDARAAESAQPGFILDSHIHCGGSEKWVTEMVAAYRPRKAMACVLTWIEDLELMVDAIASLART